MPRIPTTDTLVTEIRAMQARITLLESALRSQLAVVTADPPNPRDGDTWLRTSDNTAHIRINGVTKTFTVT